MLEGIGEEEDAIAVDGEAEGSADASLEGGAFKGVGGGGGTGTGDGLDLAAQGESSDAVVAGVGEVEIASGIEGEGGGIAKGGAGDGAIGITSDSASSDGFDLFLGGKSADAVIFFVGDVEISSVIEGESSGGVEGGLAGVGVIDEGGASVASDGGDGAASGVEESDAVCALVGDKEVAGGREGERNGVTKAGLEGGAFFSASCDGEELSFAGDLADAVVSCVGDVDLAGGGVDGDGVGSGEASRLDIAVGFTSGAIASDGRDGALGIESADAVILFVSDVKLARKTEGKAARVIE